jgi:signal transduction histidine kinase
VVTRDALLARIASLEQENARLADFAAMAAHEMQRPLLLIEACGNFVSERTAHGIDLESRRDLQTIVHVASRLRLTVEALLATARAKEVPAGRNAVDLGAVVKECLSLLADEIRAASVDVEVHPLPVVRGNRALLGGVFGNLLSNAIVHAPSGGRPIEIKAVRDPGSWIIAVEAPGPPIPEDERRSIFEPWRRGSTAGTRGTGLGLAIAQLIVEAHGGEISVTSTHDAINSFAVSLPS